MSGEVDVEEDAPDPRRYRRRHETQLEHIRHCR